VFVHDGTSFKPSKQQWVNVNGVWRPVGEVYVKQNGAWNIVAGSLPAVFNKVGGSFGVAPRPQNPEYIEPPPSESGGGGGGWDGSPTAGVYGGSIVTDGSGRPVRAESGGFVTSPGTGDAGTISA
jgi:hypothetical protein